MVTGLIAALVIIVICIVIGALIVQLATKMAAGFKPALGNAVATVIVGMQGQSGLAIEGEQHQVGLPVARLRAIGSGGRSLRERNAPLDVIHRTTPFASTPAPFTLRLRQIVAPRVIVRARNLCGDEAINRFVADATTLVLREPSGNGLWRPSQAQPLQNELLQ